MNCSNHPQSEGPFLCMSCGKWYCSRCMAHGSNPPKCMSCIVQTSNNPQIVDGLLNTVLGSTSKQAIIHIGLALLSVGFFFSANYFYSIFNTWLILTPFVVSIILQIPVFLMFRNKNNQKQSIQITKAQIDTLLRRHDFLTPELLASATNCTAEEAEKYLDGAVLRNELEIGSDEKGLTYKSFSNGTNQLK